MRILVISNFYPPHYVGGYELGCADIVAALRARGHEVTVLTSTYGVDGEKHEGDVHRLLETSFPTRYRNWIDRTFLEVRRDRRNLRLLKQKLDEARPQAVFVFSPTHVMESLGFHAESLGYPVAYFVSDYWLATFAKKWSRFNRNAARKLSWRMVVRWLRSCGSMPPAENQAVDLGIFVSHYVRDRTIEAGLEVRQPHVVYWGVDLPAFPYVERSRPARNILYSGRVEELKGVHVLIDAVANLVQRGGHDDIRLTVLGNALEPDYLQQIKRQVGTLGLDQHVTFIGRIPRDQLATVYSQHDIFVLSSIWPEPFSISTLEAMASGLIVVSTDTGGSPEAIVDGEDGIVCHADDAASMADALARAMSDDAACRRMRAAARLKVEQQYTIAGMTDRIERLLETLIGQRAAE